jgi:tetratricopeptide (TPR) repeat protein
MPRSFDTTSSIHERLLADAPADDHVLRARILVQRATAANRSQREAEASELLDQAASLIPAFGQTVLLGTYYTQRARNALQRGALDDADKAFSEAERLARQANRFDLAAEQLMNRALVNKHRNDLAGAAALLDEAYRIAEPLGAVEILNGIIGERGTLALEQGDFAGGMGHLRQQVEQSDRSVNLERRFAALRNFAIAARNAADLRAEKGALEGLLPICAQLKKTQEQCETLRNLGCVTRAEKDLAGALQRIEEWIGLAGQTNEKGPMLATSPKTYPRLRR